MQEFVTAAKREVAASRGEPDVVTFKVDGEELRAYRPEESQYVLFLAAVGMGSSGADGVAGVINFLLSILDGSSKQIVTTRLLDRNDPFGMDELQQIMEYLVEEWSGRPTESASASSTSQSSGGQNSTQLSLTSTSSDSILTAS